MELPVPGFNHLIVVAAPYFRVAREGRRCRGSSELRSIKVGLGGDSELECARGISPFRDPP